MQPDFQGRIKEFLETANKNNVLMILVGGGAVNFHGYQRHSADIDFWIETSPGNLQRLLQTLTEMGYNLTELPEKVRKGEQNISVKISPVFELELITRFNPGKSFEKAFEDSIQINNSGYKYHVLSFSDLIQSKIISNRPKDKLDIEELHKIQILKKKKR